MSFKPALAQSRLFGAPGWPRWLSGSLLGLASCVAAFSASAQTPAPTTPAPTTPTPTTAPPGTLQPLPPSTAAPAETWPQQYPPQQYPPRYSPPGNRYPPGYAPPTYTPQQPPMQVPYPYAYPSPQPRLPSSIPYEEGKQPPAGYREVEETRRGLVIGGAVTLGSTYLITLLAATSYADSNNHSSDAVSDSDLMPLFIPTVGPFIGLATLDPSAVTAGWLVLDGLVQTSGAIMLIAGMASPVKKWVRSDQGRTKWQLAPLTSRSIQGLSVLGQF